MVSLKLQGKSESRSFEQKQIFKLSTQNEMTRDILFKSDTSVNEGSRSGIDTPMMLHFSLFVIFCPGFFVILKNVCPLVVVTIMIVS